MDGSGAPVLHPLLASRVSPARFDDSIDVAPAQAESILEAARWAPSAGNSQPWAFIVGRRGDAVHARLVSHLAGSSMSWAPAAGLLVANLSHRFVEDTDWEYPEFSLYDLGQAVAHMTLQSQFLGLSTRQFRAFDRVGLSQEFAVPKHWQVTSMSAIGRAAADVSVDTAGGGASSARRRRSPGELSWPQADSAPR